MKDFPKPGIGFKDISPLLANFTLLDQASTEIALNLGPALNDIDIILGLDARGFIIGSILANKTGKGFAMARKPGKLPPPYEEIEYSLEYGTNKLSVSSNIIKPGMKVHLHDDVLATGGTIAAAIKLVEKLGATVESISFLMELTFLNGKEKLKGHKYYSVLEY